jgi:hypothetical protein
LSSRVVGVVAVELLPAEAAQVDSEQARDCL